MDEKMKPADQELEQWPHVGPCLYRVRLWTDTFGLNPWKGFWHLQTMPTESSNAVPQNRIHSSKHIKFWIRVQSHLEGTPKGRQCPPSDEEPTRSQYPTWHSQRGIPLGQRLTAASVFQQGPEGRVLAIFIKDGSKFSLMWEAMAHGTTMKQCRFLNLSLSNTVLGTGLETSKLGR